MKTTADSHTHGAEVQRAFARARARQVWMLLVLIALGLAAGFGWSVFAPKPTSRPAARLASVNSVGEGLLAQVMVVPGQQVRKGQLVAVLENSHLRMELNNAMYDLIAAMQQNQATAAPTALTNPPALKGNFEKKPVLVAPPASSTGEEKQKSLPTLPPPTANKTPEGQDPAAKAEARVKDLQGKIAQAKVDLAANTQKLTEDKQAADTAQALVTAAEQIVNRTAQEKAKSASLLAEGVISANEAAKADMYASQAQAQLQTARLKAAQAVATAGDTQRALDSENDALKSAQADLPKAQAGLDAAKKAPKPPQRPASMLPPAGKSGISPLPQYKLVPVKGTGPVPPPQPLQVNFTPPSQALVRIQRAEAALEAVQARFASTCIYAPASGRVTRVFAHSGESVHAGTAIVVIALGGQPGG